VSGVLGIRCSGGTALLIFFAILVRVNTQRFSSSIEPNGCVWASLPELFACPAAARSEKIAGANIPGNLAAAYCHSARYLRIARAAAE
jgi:hypothetical protein